MNNIEIFKQYPNQEWIETIDCFFTDQVDSSLNNEIFVSAMLNGDYYDPDKIELLKYMLEDDEGNSEEWYAIGETEENSDEVNCIYANRELEVVTEEYKKIESEKRYKGDVITSFDEWEKSINEKLVDGYIEISRNPRNSHGYFARISLFNDEGVIIEESLYTLDVEVLQDKLKENNINNQIATTLDIDVNEISLVKIIKKKESPGFDRYYEVKIELNDFNFSFVSVIPGELQSREKNIFSIIEDDLIEAYEEAKKENFTYEEVMPKNLIIK